MWIFWGRLRGASPSIHPHFSIPPPFLSWEWAGEQGRDESWCLLLLEKFQLQLDTAAPTGTPPTPRASTEKPPALKQSHTSHTQGR